MDFREFVLKLEQQGKMNVIEDEVSCAQIPSRVSKEEARRNSPLLFKRVTDGKARVVGNLFGAPQRFCQAFSVRSLPHLFRKLEAAVKGPVPIRQGPLRTGKYHLLKSPDLPQSLPLLKYSREDATPYLTAGILLTRHPSSGRRQLCFVRMAMVGGHRLLLNPATPHVRSLVNDTLGQGQELPLAVLIGPPVEIILLAGLSVPDGVDKLEVGQAMAGDGLAFSEETLPIPLGTEYVLKGRLIPQYGKEGPFGDLKGLYSVKEKNPLFFVDELRVAHDPLFHSISAGRAREHVTLVSMGPLVLLESLKRDCPGIVRYELPRFGGGRLAVFVVKQGFNPDAIAARLWRIPILRGFVFINEDVNRQSAEDLWWALLQRAKDRDNFRFSEEKHDVFQERKFVIDATAGDLASWENRRVAVFAPGKAR